jgi:hypothetical protein
MVSGNAYIFRKGFDLKNMRAEEDFMNPGDLEINEPKKIESFKYS